MTLIVGDIHGCYDELQSLLDKAGIGDEEELISLGDIVDRGPASPQTLLYLQQRPHTRILMGNHERKHVRHAQGEVKLSYSQRITIAQFGELSLNYGDALDFMAELPLFLELPEAILVHGYLEPGVALAAQRATVLTGTMSGDSYLRKKYDQPWYELYQGQKPVIVGHRNYNRSDLPFVFRDLIYGLDTSVYMGGAMTGLVLPQFRLVSVPARTNHWRKVHHQYRHLLAPQKQAREIPPEQWPMEKVCDWLEKGSGPQAELDRVGPMVTEARVVFPRIPGALNKLYRKTLDEARGEVLAFDRLSAREQGRVFDKLAGQYPPVVRALLHGLRQGESAETSVRDQLQSPAEILVAWNSISGRGKSSA